MNPLSLFFKKQYAVEEKIQRLLRYLEDMGQLYRGAYEAYLDGNYDDLLNAMKISTKLKKKWTIWDFRFK